MCHAQPLEANNETAMRASEHRLSRLEIGVWKLEVDEYTSKNVLIRRHDVCCYQHWLGGYYRNVIVCAKCRVQEFNRKCP